MDVVLTDLTHSLRSALQNLNGSARPLLQDALHDTDKLPDPKISSLASDALDALSELRLLLEPGHMILAHHFFGKFSLLPSQA